MFKKNDFNFYHGTIMENVSDIKRSGKINTSMGEFEYDGTFITNNVRVAMRYAIEQCSRRDEIAMGKNKFDTCNPIVLKIKIPSEFESNLMPDWNRIDDLDQEEIKKFGITKDMKWQDSLKVIPELIYKDPIPIDWVDGYCEYSDNDFGCEDKKRWKKFK